MIPSESQKIYGRAEVISYGHALRKPLYQVQVPLQWQRVNPPEDDLLQDLRKPLVKFVIEPGLNLVIHNYPTDSIEERTNQALQIEEWSKPFKICDWSSQECSQYPFSGFYFEGRVENKKISAWNLQLDPNLYQMLRFLAATVDEEEHYKQMRADYTIKVSGPCHLMEKHRDAIQFFVSSFHLIDSLPSPAD